MSPKEPKGAPRQRFRTFSAKQAGWGPGQQFNLAANKYYDQLPEKFRNVFDIQSLRVAILDVPRAHLYQIFKRYNTGSVSLNAAEIRNAVYQLTDIHEMMFRLGGEYLDKTKYMDKEEERVGEDLRQIMGTRRERYGAYDFIGRFFGFVYDKKNGTVAKATVAFMEAELKANKARIEELKQEFISAFDATLMWYEDYPLIQPRQGGAFHAFLGTIQTVSSRYMLLHIKAERITEDKVAEYIKREWLGFAQMVLENKQNSTNFWRYQKEWIARLEEGLGLTGSPAAGT